MSDTIDDAELSLKIAEYLGLVKGPYPVAGKWRNVQDGTMTEVKIPNMVTDPAMRDMLQAKLLEDGWRIEMIYLPKTIGFVISLFDGAFMRHRIEADTRERLWAEAAAKVWRLI
jgi:hypothetical protein